MSTQSVPRAGPLAAALTCLVVASACQTTGGPRSPAGDVGVPTSDVSSPYQGPLDIALDYSDNAGPRARSGAAGRALECDNEVYDGGGSNYNEGGPEELRSNVLPALRNFLLNASAIKVPRQGYRLESRRGHRVLLSFDVRQRSKAAFILADNVRNHEGDRGWGVTSWAHCDPAEYPPAVTNALGIVVWKDAKGARVPLAKVRSFTGSPDCWPHSTFLDLGSREQPEEYIRQPTPDMVAWLRGTYSPRSRLPPTAVDTGIRHAGQELWLVHRRAAYLVSLRSRGHVERWPGATEPLRCS